MRPGKHIFFLLFIYSGLPCFGQLEGEARIDSLIKALPRQKEDTNKVNLLDDIAMSYRNYDPGKGLQYAAKDLALATKLGWKKGIAYAHMAHGLNYLNSSEMGKALSSFTTALNLFKEIKWSRGEATVLGNIGVVYSETGDHAKAKEYYRSQLDLSRRTRNKKDEAFATGQMANTYNRMAQYDSAISYYNKAIALYKELGKKNSIALNLMNIGTLYNMKADFPKAIDHYLQAMKIFEETGNKREMASLCTNIGTVYTAMSNRDKALEFFHKGAKLSEEVQNKLGQGYALSNIGTIYHEKRDHKNALKFYSAALNICEQIGDKEGIAWASAGMGEIFAEQHDPVAGITYCLKALRLGNAIGEPRLIATTLNQLGNAYLYLAADSTPLLASREYVQGEFIPDRNIPHSKAELLNSAIAYLKYALDTSVAIGNADITQNCYTHLALAYRLKGDYKLALEYTDKVHAFADSVYSMESKVKVMEADIQNDYDRKRLSDSLKNIKQQVFTEVKLQRQRAYTITGIALAGMLAIVSLVVVKNNKKLENERHRSEDLLLNILPSEVAKELKEKGEAQAQYHEHVTVLFTDFVSFTKSAEKSGPKVIIEELHHCFTVFDEITSKYGIEKIKTIGDAYLAVAGLPMKDDEHAAKVVRAAIDIRDFMKQRYAHLGSRTFEIRIGIHSGSVVSGIVGVKKFAYDIWGDTVNTAARMEQNSEPGEINISESTYELVKDKFTCTYRGEFEAKNKGLLKMYFVS